MATMTLTIPNELVQPLLDAFKTVYPIPEDDQGDPLYQPVEWARLKIRAYVRETYIAAQAITAAEQARQTAADAADSDSAGIIVS